MSDDRDRDVTRCRVESLQEEVGTGRVVRRLDEGEGVEVEVAGRVVRLVAAQPRSGRRLTAIVTAPRDCTIRHIDRPHRPVPAPLSRRITRALEELEKRTAREKGGNP